MYRLLLISLLALFGSAVALSDVNRQCIADNSEVWSNDNLIGTWYKIWRFTMFGGMVPSSSCSTLTFSRPSAETVQEYKDHYNDPNLPYNIDDNPVLIENANLWEGLLFGNTVAKFYVLSPNETMSLVPDGYAVDAYRQLTPKYIMYKECALRGNTLWLLTSDRYAPIDEMRELIKNTPEFANLGEQRYCDTY